MREKIQRGFTLVELLVVIAIVGILVTFLSASFTRTQEKAKIAKAKADLAQLRAAVTSLLTDTNRLPGPTDINQTLFCTEGPELFIDTCEAGLTCNTAVSGGFTNWQGPYMSTVGLDPWGNRYIFDGDYVCRTNVEGCKDLPNNTTVRAVHSAGRVGCPTTMFNDYDCGLNPPQDRDNVVLVLCRRP